MEKKEYLEKLRKKPVHERERIAIIATAVSFLIILTIWLITFSEMNKSPESEDLSPASQKLQDLKNEVGDGKKSIEEMWNDMPSQDISPNTGLENGGVDQNMENNPSESDVNPQEDQQNKEGQTEDNQIPQLP